jgi:hypothetical protein
MEMKKLLTATALTAALLLSGNAHAGDDLPDYSDKTNYTCNKDDIEEHMASMIDNSPAGKLGVKLLYIKGEPVETARKSNELRCRIEIKTNQFSMKGIFRFHNEDGHSLVGWQANKNK